MNESELEAQVRKMFADQDWDCDMDYTLKFKDHNFRPDITLSKNGKVIGYVECYSKHKRMTPEFQQQILHIFDIVKPELFILTDGVVFETYVDGDYKGTMTVPISYQSYSTPKRLFAYAQKFKEVSDAKNSN